MSPRAEVLTRLRKIVGLLASSHDGEILAAAGRANALLAQSRLSWSEVIIGGEFEAPPPSRHRHADRQQAGFDIQTIPTAGMSDAMLRAYAREFLAGHALGDYDIGRTDFFVSLLRLDNWSPKQRAGLVRCLRRAWMIKREAGLGDNTYNEGDAP